MWMSLLISIVIGGLICMIVQIIMDNTPFFISNAHVLVALILIGEIISFFGWYQPFIDWASMGAAVPLSGFGHTLMRGVEEAMAEQGLLGILSGGFTAGAVGLAAAIVFGYFVAIIFRPRG